MDIQVSCHLSLEKRDRKNMSINANRCLLNEEIDPLFLTYIYQRRLPMTACCVKQTSIKCCLSSFFFCCREKRERRTMTMIMINSLMILPKDIQQTFLPVI
jgi:hypothetical protein